MRPILRYRMPAAALAAVLVGALLPVSPAAAADPLSAPCADVDLVFARGSGQDLNETERVRFRDQVVARIDGKLTYNNYELGSSVIDGKQYPAVAVGSDSWNNFWTSVGAGISGGGAFAYGDSVNTGVDELTSYLTARAASCPNSLFVLGGYSQGAQTVGEAYVEKLTPSLRDKVVYEAFFGDPRLNLPEGRDINLPDSRYVPACMGTATNSEWRFDVPDCFVNTGSLGARDPYLPAGYTAATGLSCASHDFVCGSSGVFWDAEGHKTYANPGGSIDKAADEIARRLAKLRPDAGIETVGDHPAGGTAGLDVAFLIDSTGSMGWQIEDAKTFASQMATTIKSVNGRVALVEYKDAGDTITAKILSGFQEDTGDFNTQLATIYASGGGDTPEAALHALMTSFNGLQWRNGSTKAAVILTDAGYHDPDVVDGSTLDAVARRALEIDPVNVYPVVPDYIAPQYQALANATTGQVIVNTGDTAGALMTALTKLKDRPVVSLAYPDYYAPPKAAITFDASRSYSTSSTIVKYDWDFDGDGTFDQTTTAPSTSHTYAAAWDGTMQVRATDANGAVANASAKVHVGAGPNADRPAAPTAVKAVPTSPAADGTSTVQVSWTQAGTGAYRWGITVNGIPSGVVDGSATQATVTDVRRAQDVEIGVVGFTKDGLIGVPATATVPARSKYAFNGFLAPVAALPTVNAVQAGRAVPMKFGLGGDFGQGILGQGSPSSVRVACDTGAAVGDVAGTTTAGASSLSYSAADGTYTYVWKTDKAWAGTCRMFRLGLDDGTAHEAMFRFS